MLAVVGHYARRARALLRAQRPSIQIQVTSRHASFACPSRQMRGSATRIGIEAGQAARLHGGGGHRHGKSCDDGDGHEDRLSPKAQPTQHPESSGAGCGRRTGRFPPKTAARRPRLCRPMRLRCIALFPVDHPPIGVAPCPPPNLCVCAVRPICVCVCVCRPPLTPMFTPQRHAASCPQASWSVMPSRGARCWLPRSRPRRSRPRRGGARWSGWPSTRPIAPWCWPGTR